MSDLSIDTKKHTTKSHETIPLKEQYHKNNIVGPNSVGLGQGANPEQFKRIFRQ
jgi:hypothetical protein